MTALTLPCTIFKTRHCMNDYTARDMRCGDLTAYQLQHQYHMDRVSTKVDPYHLKKIRPFTPSQYQLSRIIKGEENITLQQCAKIMFDEFRSAAQPFSFYGPYRHLITEMISHMQYNNGAPFSHMLLDMALERKIRSDTSVNSILNMIRNTLKENMNWRRNIYPAENAHAFRTNILKATLPKFTSVMDNFNGMAISVHDTWATHITLTSLEVREDGYLARIHFKVQDHFGLDDNDATQYKSRGFSFIGLWFVLQHYDRLGFKPFMTNMQSIIEIHGSKNEYK